MDALFGMRLEASGSTDLRTAKVCGQVWQKTMDVNRILLETKVWLKTPRENIAKPCVHSQFQSQS